MKRLLDILFLNRYLGVLLLIFSSTTHRIGDTYITSGSGGYRATTHRIGDDIYRGRDNRGSTWNIYDDLDNKY